MKGMEDVSSFIVQFPPDIKIILNMILEAFIKPYNWCMFSVLFNWIQFRNDICTARTYGHEENFIEYGVCYTSEECNSRGGSHKANCAAGYGACCVCKLSIQMKRKPCVFVIILKWQYFVSINYTHVLL